MNSCVKIAGSFLTDGVLLILILGMLIVSVFFFIYPGLLFAGNFDTKAFSQTLKSPVSGQSQAPTDWINKNKIPKYDESAVSNPSKAESGEYGQKLFDLMMEVANPGYSYSCSWLRKIEETVFWKCSVDGSMYTAENLCKVGCVASHECYQDCLMAASSCYMMDPICPNGEMPNPVTNKCEVAPTFSGCASPAVYTYDSGLDICWESVDCPFGGQLNETTDRCEINISDSQCPLEKGYHYSNPDHACLKPVSCGSGSYNSSLDKCEVTPVNPCDTGYEWFLTEAKCKINPVCSWGQYSGGNDRCEISGSISCPHTPNYAYNASYGKCVASHSCPLGLGGLNTNTDKCEYGAAPTCAGGNYTINGSWCEWYPRCDMYAGTSYSATQNKCSKLGGANCPSGYSVLDQYTCIKTPDCPGGTLSGNTCYANPAACPAGTPNFTTDYCEQAPQCNTGAGFGWSYAYDTCVKDATPDCSAYASLGYSFSGSSGRCEKSPPNCPAGGGYSNVNNRCEATATQNTTCETANGNCAASSKTLTVYICNFINTAYMTSSACTSACSFGCTTRSLPVYLNSARNGDRISVWGRYHSWDNFNIKGKYSCSNGTWSLIAVDAGNCSKWGVCNWQCPTDYLYTALPSEYSAYSANRTTCYSTNNSSLFRAAGGGYNIDTRTQLCYNWNNCANTPNYPTLSGSVCIANFNCDGYSWQDIPGGADKCYVSANPNCGGYAYSGAIGKCTDSYWCNGGLSLTANIGGNSNNDLCRLSLANLCPSGYGSYNTSTNQCSMYPPSCSPYSYNSTYNRCETAPLSYTCTGGTSPDPVYTGYCTAGAVCDYGSLNDTVDKCRTSLSYSCTSPYQVNGTTCQASPTCPPDNNTLSYDPALNLCAEAVTFVCPGDKQGYDSSTNVCYKGATCPQGEGINTVTDKCELAKTVTCADPANYDYFGAPQYICRTRNTYCQPDGAYDTGLNSCKIPASSTSVCPQNTGYVYEQGSVDKCVWGSPPPCPNAEDVYDGLILNKCTVPAEHTCPNEPNYAYSSSSRLCEAFPVCTSGDYNEDLDKCYAPCDVYVCQDAKMQEFTTMESCKQACSAFVCSKDSSKYNSGYGCKSACKEDGTCISQ